MGPTCHLNKNSCFIDAPSSTNFIDQLEQIIDSRFDDANLSSYTYQLYKDGIKEIAKKAHRRSWRSFHLSCNQ